MPEYKSKTSIVIPFYNLNQYLDRCLRSCLNQRILSDIIVVDDASSEPPNIPEQDECLIRVIRNEKNQGLSESRNNGAKIAQTEYILTLDPDDRLAPNTIAELELPMDIDSRIGVVFMKMRMFGDRDGELVPPIIDRDITAKEWLETNRIYSTSLIRKSALEQVGYWRDIEIAEDWDLWIRLAMAGWKFKFCPSTFYFHHIRGDSKWEKDIAKYGEDYKQMIRDLNK